MMFKNISNNYMSSRTPTQDAMLQWHKENINAWLTVCVSRHITGQSWFHPQRVRWLWPCAGTGGRESFSTLSTLPWGAPRVYVRACWRVCVHAFVSCLLCLKVLRWPPPSRVPHWRVWLGCCCHRRYRPRPLMCPATLGKGGGEDRAASFYSGTNR